MTEQTMERGPQHTEDEATSVEEPDGRPPDDGMPYDPEMTDADEANVPPDSEADPEREG